MSATTRVAVLDVAARLQLQTGDELPAACVGVLEGRLRVVVCGPDGSEISAAVLGVGSWWIGMAGTVLRASEASLVAVLDAHALDALSQRHARVARAITADLQRQSELIETATRRDVASIAMPRRRRAVAGTSWKSGRSLHTEGVHVPPSQLDTEPLDTEALVGKPRAWRGKVPVVLQLDAMDCGAAVLASTARGLGVPVTLAKARDAVGTAAEGTSLVGLVRGAAELGIGARMVKTSVDRIEDLPLPAILHVNGNHWIVADRRVDGGLRIMDPAAGRRRLTAADLESRWSGFAAVFDGPIEPVAQLRGALDPLRWIRDHLRPQRNRLLAGVLLSFVAAGLQMVAPTFSGYVIDRVILPGRLEHLPLVIAIMTATLVLSAGVGMGQRALLSWASIQVDGSALDSLTARLLALPMSYFATRRIGDVQRRLAGLTQIRGIAIAAGVSALAALTQLIVALALMVRYSPFLTGAYLVTVPLYVFVLRRASRRLRPMFEGIEEGWGLYGSRQIDALRNIETVKALGAEDAVRRSLSGQFVGLRRRMFSTDLTVMSYDAVLQVLSLLSMTAMLTIGAREVVHGHLSLGDLVAFNGFVALASGPISSGLALFDQLQLVRTLFDRISDVLEAEPEPTGSREVKRIRGRVDVRGLSFQFPGPTATPVLHDIRLSVAPGALVAIVGRSGSGKTTLGRCLAGLLPAPQGSLLVDGLDSVELGMAGLRRHVGVVLSTCEVFDGTVRENITFGREDVDDADVRWAIATSGLAPAELPDGLETLLGENGVHLSAGQLQRLALARAIHHRPSMLVLDEPTAHLDAESKRTVRAGILQMAQGRTTFLITHDPEDARDADLVLVLDGGHIVERGTHAELMRRYGLYHHLHTLG